jgi:radical SAM protein with 4Fe4S-binding SPASM domain
MATLGQKARLLHGLLTGDCGRGGPFLVLVDSTGRCNLRCPGCRYHSPLLNTAPLEEDLPLPLFKRLCDEISTLGCARLILTGEGEPLLHPQWPQLLATARRRGLHTTLYTNATLLDQQAAQSMLEHGPDTLIVSLWAADSESYAQAYPGADSQRFPAIVENVRTLARLKAERRLSRPHIKLYYPINRSNHRALPLLVDLVRTMGCDELAFSPFRTRRGQLHSLALDVAQVDTVCGQLESMRPRLQALGLAHNLNETVRRYREGEDEWQRIPCYVGWVQAHVQADGTVHPCKSCATSMGNLHQQSFAAIWNGSELRRFRRDLLSPQSAAARRAGLDCGYCGQLAENRRIHRVFRWLPRSLKKLTGDR